MDDASTGLPEGHERLVRLGAIGLVAGLFSALFGVGGGVIVVPLLVAFVAYDPRLATATSLAAIIITAAVGTAAHGALGNVDWEKAALIGIPAMAGVTIGIAVKDRISTQMLTYGFCVLLLAAAVRLAVV